MDDSICGTGGEGGATLRIRKPLPGLLLPSSRSEERSPPPLATWPPCALIALSPLSPYAVKVRSPRCPAHPTSSSSAQLLKPVPRALGNSQPLPACSSSIFPPLGQTWVTFEDTPPSAALSGDRKNTPPTNFLPVALDVQQISLLTLVTTSTLSSFPPP